MRITRSAALFLLAHAALAAACGSDGGGSAAGADAGLDRAAVAVGCDHFQYGEEEAITASATPDEHEHVHPHERLIVTLPGAEGAHLGYLHVHAEGAPEGYLLFGTPVPVEATDPADGHAVAPTAEGDATAGCDQAARVLRFALPAEGLYLKVGPTDVATFTLVSHVIGATETEPDEDAGAADADAHVH